MVPSDKPFDSAKTNGEPLSDPPPKDFDVAIFLRTPTPVILAAWGCFVVMISSFAFGNSLSDSIIASFVLTAGLLMQIQGRIIWWIVMTLLVIALFYYLAMTIESFTRQATWFQQTVSLLSLLITGIICGLLLLPTSRHFYREVPEHNL